MAKTLLILASEVGPAVTIFAASILSSAHRASASSWTKHSSFCPPILVILENAGFHEYSCTPSSCDRRHKLPSSTPSFFGQPAKCEVAHISPDGRVLARVPEPGGVHGAESKTS
jgi:hypothetical protein